MWHCRNSESRRAFGRSVNRRTDGSNARASRPGRHEPLIGRRGRPRPHAPEHHRSVERAAADVQLPMSALDYVQRRDLQLPRAARGAGRRGPSSSRRSRDTEVSCTSIEEYGRGLRPSTQRPVGLRHLGHAPARRCSCRAIAWACVRSSTPCQRHASLRARRSRRCSPIRAWSAQSRSGRRSTSSSRSGRRSAPAHDVRGRLRAAAGTLDDRRRRRHQTHRGYWQPIYEATNPAIDARRAPPSELLELLVDADAHPPAGRRAGRRLPERRSRFDGHHGAHQALHRRRRCARSRWASRTPSSTRARYQQEVIRYLETDHEAIRCTSADIGARLPGCHLAHREAGAAHGAGPAVSAVAAGARSRLQGRAHRRGLRRDPRRLRHLQGSQDSPLLGAPARLEDAADAAAASLPVHEEHPGASPRRTCGRSSGPRAEDLRDPFFSHLPRWELTAKLKLFYSADLRARLGVLRPDRASSRQRCPPTFDALGRLLVRRSISRPLTCCPATSSRRRAIGWRWRTRSRGGSRSSTTASSQFAASLPPHLKMKVLNEKYLLKRAVRGLIPETRAPAEEAAVSSARRRELLRTGRHAAGLRRRTAVADAAGRRRALQSRRRRTGWSPRRAPGRSSASKDNMAVVGILSTQLLVDQFIRNFRYDTPCRAKYASSSSTTSCSGRLISSSATATSFLESGIIDSTGRARADRLHRAKVRDLDRRRGAGARQSRLGRSRCPPSSNASSRRSGAAWSDDCQASFSRDLLETRRARRN